MANKRTPDSTAWFGATSVPAIASSKPEILRRPFTLHEAAYLVASPEEWDQYMNVGREPGMIEVLLPSARSGTRFQMRMDLEAEFWRQIQLRVVEAQWRVMEISPIDEKALSRFQITSYENPFIMQIASQLTGKPAPTQLVFEAVDRAPVVPERHQWEADAVAYMKVWKTGRPARIPVRDIHAAINAKFPQYNFGERALRRIRKNAGLTQRRGAIALGE